MNHSSPDKSKAFTLSELLISLSVLGLISALTLPSVFNAVNNQRRNAIFKESIQAMQTVYYRCISDGSCPSRDMQNVFKDFNVTRICDETNESECRTISDAEDGEHGMVLASGAYIWGLKSPHTYPVDLFYIDYNGPEDPNTVGQDIIYMSRCFGLLSTSPGVDCATDGNMVDTKPGQVGVNIASTPSLTLYNELYQ